MYTRPLASDDCQKKERNRVGNIWDMGVNSINGNLLSHPPVQPELPLKNYKYTGLKLKSPSWLAGKEQLGWRLAYLPEAFA